MIQVIRGKQVLLDHDLATLYGVETKRINEQVKRNTERFPEKFCFQLNTEEISHKPPLRGVACFAPRRGCYCQRLNDAGFLFVQA
ncbi:ORF6N domain-containing protein, partial [Fibrobacter succinogenes]|uniref:ORF6N domain-containing protein n=1 Tax=Fibrobacter succinogenes TaxID=833 RepID=UPI001569FEB1